MRHIRNFCIIAHIDHGKSTLADRLLEQTGTVAKRDMKAQLLDSMDLERERGITIKLAPARMNYRAKDGQEYMLNLIDTPGHVDFAYEVSRSLAAVEGAILLVDASQGVQAQTLGNLYLAMEQNLEIIPVVNKIDMPSAEPERVREELMQLIGCRAEDVIFASGKTGQGIPEILESVVKNVPSPSGDAAKPLRALVFDSIYDTYKGVVAYVRVIDGTVKARDHVMLAATHAESEVLEVGFFTPKFQASPTLNAGEIGYIVTGLKEIDTCRVGDTVTIKDFKEQGVQILEGYKESIPMVFAGIFPAEGDNYERLREAMLKLKLNDASLMFDPEHSPALGFGFRTGFLGLLHMEIVRERLLREHNIDVIVTTPSVAYHINKTDGSNIIARSPSELPDIQAIREIEEPWVAVDIVSPRDYIGGIMGLVADKRGVYKNTEYLKTEGEGRIILHYDMPLAGVLVDFYDRLKSVTSGYASLNYELNGYKVADVQRMDILVNEEQVEALACIVYRDEAEREGRRIVERLQKAIPRAQYDIKIQAALGGKVVASERIKPFRKDVIAGLSGGDWTRKMKLLQKQKKGKAKMTAKGHVEIPPEAYIAVLKRD